MPSLQDIASCIAGYDPQALAVEQARSFIARMVPVVDGAEHVPIRCALGRVLGADVISPIDVPAHDNAAMDGFALRGCELQPGADTRFAIAGAGLAGAIFEGSAGPGQCVRITTGAVMPAGLDTVVPHELTRVEGDEVVVPPDVVGTGDNRRPSGEDLKRGEPALHQGRRVTPADLGLLASLGIGEASVFRKLRVAFFSTGDELRSVGEPLPEGCVYDSNRYTVWAMLRRLGVDTLDLGVVRDDPQALEAAFRSAAANADAVITSGGVSAGEADHTKRIMAKLGDVLFWHIAMRPGRPLAVGRIGGAVLFGLPGNPVAVMVAFYAFVRDALLRMGGATPVALPLLRARCLAPLRKKAGRTEYQRAIVEPGDDGRWQVRITGAQGSGILSSMSRANGLVLLHHDQGSVAAGDEVDVIPFEGLL